MYDDFKVANYPKSVVSPELYARHLSRLFTGDVIDGFTVTPGTGLQVVLAPGNALIRYGSGAVASAREVSLVNNLNLAIGTPDASNPRIDLVVVYVDNNVSLPSGTPSAANLDGKGVAKAKIVPGTPAATPSAPNATAIQASVGAGNPYTVVAQVRVDNGVTVIAANLITDRRSLTIPNLPERSVGASKIEQTLWSGARRGTVNSPSSATAYSPVSITGGLSVIVPAISGAKYKITTSATFVSGGSGEVSVGLLDPETGTFLGASTYPTGNMPLSGTWEWTASSTSNKTIEFKVSAQQTGINIRTDNPRIEVARIG